METISKSGFKYNLNYNNKPDFKFNSVCIDNFFSDPDEIRNLGLSISKEPDDLGRWPGVRSKNLYEIDEDLHTLFCLKVLSCYYDLRFVDLQWTECTSKFQVVPYSKESKYIDEGWIHSDYGHDLAGIIYLTPNADLNTGTSLFNLKPNEEKNYLSFGSQSEKMAFYRDKKSLSENYLKQLKSNNNKFYEKTRFQNVYNRLVMYDANEYHKANSFNTGENVDDRMTLVFFFSGIKSEKTKYPIERVKDKENFDDALKYRLEYLKNENIKSKTITSEETDISDK